MSNWYALFKNYERDSNIHKYILINYVNIIFSFYVGLLLLGISMIFPYYLKIKYLSYPSATLKGKHPW